MEDLVPVKFFFIGDDIVDGYEEGKVRSFGIRNTPYSGLKALITAMPRLTSPECRWDLIQLICFMESQDRFEAIKDPAAFKTRYAGLMEGDPDEAFPPLHRQYGPYVTDEVAEPQVADGKLTYYARDIYTEVPYRVTCSFPPAGNIADTRYELLPLAAEVEVSG